MLFGLVAERFGPFGAVEAQSRCGGVEFDDAAEGHGRVGVDSFEPDGAAGAAVAADSDGAVFQLELPQDFRLVHARVLIVFVFPPCGAAAGCQRPAWRCQMSIFAVKMRWCQYPLCRLDG